jgi:hypothetical protein
MKELELAIKNLYLIFSKYTTEGIHFCNCGCINEEDVKKLNSKQLKELEQNDLASYHGSALYTWGEVVHYKHYLPRVCELRSTDRNFPFIDLDEIYTKLEYAKWTEWDKNERKAILDYVIADWIEFANKTKSDITDTVFNNYGNFIEIQELVKLWEISNSKNKNALRNFVNFFYYHGSQILNGGLKINGKIYKEEFSSILQTNNLIEKLELEFFKYENIDQEYAANVSIVLQMIEQELKIKNGR